MVENNEWIKFNKNKIINPMNMLKEMILLK